MSEGMEVCDFYTSESDYLTAQVVNIGLQRLSALHEQALTFEKIETLPITDTFPGQRVLVSAKLGEDMRHIETEIALTWLELDTMAKPYRDSMFRKTLLQVVQEGL